MSGRLRGILIAGAVLLAGAALAWLRLDLDAIQLQANRVFEENLDAGVVIGATKPVLFPFVGAKLSDVTLTMPGVDIHADRMFVHVSLLPLLVGKLEISQVRLDHANFNMHAMPQLAGPALMLSRLPFARLQIVHGAVSANDTRLPLDDFTLDLRDIGPNRTAPWEFQARIAGHLLHIFGKIDMKQGYAQSGFGKLRLEDVPVRPLRPYMPKWLASSLHDDDQLTGAFTLDVSGEHAWAAFGDLALTDAKGEVARLRGKLESTVDGSLRWRDSFLHLADGGVIGITGSCDGGQCRSEMNGNNVPMHFLQHVWAEGVKKPDNLTGSMNFRSALQWHGTDWSAHGRADFTHVGLIYGEQLIELPALRLDVARMNGHGWQWHMGAAHLSVAGNRGEMVIRADYDPLPSLEAEIRTGGIEQVWEPMGNVFLATLGQKSLLHGTGRLQGSLRFHTQPSVTGIAMRVDLTEAAVAYGESFNKPLGIRARGDVDLIWQQGRLALLQVKDGQLDRSHVSLGQWGKAADGEAWVIEDAAVDLDGMQKSGIRLAKQLDDYHGTLTGQLQGVMSRGEAGSPPRFSGLEGLMVMHDFGPQGWSWNGHFTAENDVVHTPQLRIDGEPGYAELSGQWDLGAGQAELDLLSAEIDTSQLKALPAWGVHRFAGHVRQAQLHLLDNELADVEADYRLDEGGLKLTGLRGNLAGGTVSSPIMELWSGDGGIRFEGEVVAGDIDIRAVKGIDKLLGDQLHGRLGGKLNIGGQLPYKDIGAWHGDGRLVVEDGEWLPPKAGRAIERLHIPKLAELYGFGPLDIGFRLRDGVVELPQISLKKGRSLYTGSGRVDADGGVSGSIVEKRGGKHYAIGGTWPKPTWSETRR